MPPKLTGKQYGFLNQLVHFVYITHYLPETFTIEPAPQEHIYIGPTKFVQKNYFYYPDAMECLVVLLDYGYIEKIDEDGIQKFRITKLGRVFGNWDSPFNTRLKHD